RPRGWADRCPRRSTRRSTAERAFVNNTCMADRPDPTRTLERDLRDIFGGRLQSFVVYGSHAHDTADADSHGAHGHVQSATHTLAVVDTLTAQDLRACA